MRRSDAGSIYYVDDATLPKRNLETERILTLFGRDKWKNGTVKIVPLAAYNKVARYYPYLAFFKIIRPKC